MAEAAKTALPTAPPNPAAPPPRPRVLVPHVPKILQNQLAKDEFARGGTWIVKTLEPGITKDDMLKSSFWMNVARNLRRGDRIEVLSPDNAWYAEFIVRAANDLDLVIGELSYTEFEEMPTRNLNDYDITYTNDATRWRVVRKSDKKVIKDGLATKQIAEAWVISAPMPEAT